MNIKLILSAGFAVTNTVLAFAQDRPNVLLILADDFGYGSLNCYGADENLVRTPNINRLSDNGIRFVNAYASASISTPTRYSLLTGSYSWRSSLKYGVLNTNDPLLVPPESVTLADVFKEEGYRTAAIGKWHLGYTDHKHDYTGRLVPGPLDLGFDYHFGLPQNNDDYTGVFVENDRVYGLRSTRKVPYSKSYYGKPYLGLDAPQRDNKTVLQELTDKAVSWLRSSDSDQPFFLYFASSAVHHPITPSDYMRGMSEAGPYGDFIQDMDRSVGQILETLEYMGELDNTLVIFTSDNGGDIPGKESPETYAVEKGLEINSKLRGDKHTIWEGGTRVPFIVYWKGKVAEGTVSSDIVCMTDVFATMAELLGKELPYNETVAPDSFSFLGAVLGNAGSSERRSIVTADANGVQAIRNAGWKYIDDYIPESLPANKKEMLSQNLKPQLYNIGKDETETVDVISANRKIADDMKKELERIREKGSRFL